MGCSLADDAPEEARSSKLTVPCGCQESNRIGRTGIQRIAHHDAGLAGVDEVRHRRDLGHNAAVARQSRVGELKAVGGVPDVGPGPSERVRAGVVARGTGQSDRGCVADVAVRKGAGRADAVSESVVTDVEEAPLCSASTRYS